MSSKPTPTKIFVAVAAALIVVFLCAPVLAILPISFSSGAFLSYPIPGWSLQWYESVLQPYPWMFALKNSLVVGLFSTLLSLVLGTSAAYGLTATRFRGQQLVMVMLLAPMVVPVVISGVAIYFLMAQFGLLGSYLGLVLAHTVLALPFVVITVSATLQNFDRNLVRAASSLGARPLSAFLSVTLPIILPGVVSGGIFAFVTSFDEVVVALFISSPHTLTLPRQLFSGLRDQVTPSLVAIASMLIVLSVALMALLGWLRQRSDRMLTNTNPE